METNTLMSQKEISKAFLSSTDLSGSLTDVDTSGLYQHGLRLLDFAENAKSQKASDAMIEALFSEISKDATDKWVFFGATFILRSFLSQPTTMLGVVTTNGLVLDVECTPVFRRNRDRLVDIISRIRIFIFSCLDQVKSENQSEPSPLSKRIRQALVTYHKKFGRKDIASIKSYISTQESLIRGYIAILTNDYTIRIAENGRSWHGPYLAVYQDVLHSARVFNDQVKLEADVYRQHEPIKSKDKVQFWDAQYLKARKELAGLTERYIALKNGSQYHLELDLIDAIKRHDFGAFHRVLAEKPNLNIWGDHNFPVPPLHAAASEGSAEMVRTLIAEGAEVNPVISGYIARTALYHAAEGNHCRVGRILLENGAQVNVESMLHLHLDDDDRVKHAEVKKMVSPLETAIQSTPQDDTTYEFVRLLVEFDADIDEVMLTAAVSSRAKLAIFQECAARNRLTLDDLKKYFPAVSHHFVNSTSNKQDLFDNLFSHGHYAFVQWLLQNKYIPCSDTYRHKRLLLSCVLDVSGQHADAAEELITFLLGLPDMNVNQRDDFKKKPLHIALERCLSEQRVEKLAEMTALKFHVGKDFESFIVLAIQKTFSNKTVKKLLDEGASPNHHSDDAECPLITALHLQPANSELLSMLLDHKDWSASQTELEAMIVLADKQNVASVIVEKLKRQHAEETARTQEGEAEKARKAELISQESQRETEYQPKSNVAEEQASGPSVEEQWDRVACWDATGNRWKKGGTPDHSFYTKCTTKNFFDEARSHKKTRTQVIEQHLEQTLEELAVEQHQKELAVEQHQKELAVQRSTKPTQPKKKSVPKVTTVKPVEAIPSNESAISSEAKSCEPPQPVAEVRVHGAINWDEPPKQKAVKKRKPRKNPNVNRLDISTPDTEASVIERVSIKAAADQCVLLDTMHTWRSRTQDSRLIVIELCEDVLWHGVIIVFHGIASMADHGSVFTADDAHALKLSSNAMHRFPSPDVLLEMFAKIRDYLGPRLMAYQQQQTANSPLVDLSKSKLFKWEKPFLDLNTMIAQQHQRIARYSQQLKSTAGMQETAFIALAKQNQGTDILKSTEDDEMILNVLAARAIEACLMRLDVLYNLYFKSFENNQTLHPSHEVFAWELKQLFRLPITEEFPEQNQKWHFSPVDAESVKKAMEASLRLYRPTHEDRDKPRIKPSEISNNENIDNAAAPHPMPKKPIRLNANAFVFKCREFPK